MATTWDPLHTDASWTMSNGNLTLTASTAVSIYSVSNTRKTIASGGKFYAEFSFSGIGGTLAIAFADSTYSVPGPINTGQSFVVVNNDFTSCWGTSETDSAWASGTHRIDLAVDLDSTPHRYYTRLDGGAWNASGDPAAQTGGATPGATESVDLRMAVSSNNLGTVVTMNPGSSAFAGTMPTGYAAWDSSVPLPTISHAQLIG